MKSWGQRASQNQEQRIAEDINGKTTKASGATEFQKGDVRSKAGNLLVEAKTTVNKSFSLKVDEITKIQGEALMNGAEDWAMQIQFQGPLGLHKKVVVLDWETYLDLRAKAGK